jgi:hypothetical protein
VTTSGKPNQPSICYKADNNGRRFQEGWYKRWQWLDWNYSLERVFCFPCRMVRTQIGEHLFSKNSESTFTTTGYCSWADATRRFNKHEGSSCHAECVVKWSSYTKGVNVASQLSHHYSENQKKAQAMLLKILSTVRYLARQGLALRGHISESGNFQALLGLRSEDDLSLKEWMLQKQSFTSHAVQNEYLELMSHHVSRGLLDCIREAKYYSIVADEVTDQARQHQLGISIRWVDKHFEVNEDFLTLALLPQGDAETITCLIKDFLCRSSLLIENCRGQCYDGASVMAGHVSGVSKRITDEEPRAVFVHCLAHSLNLALQESARQSPTYRDMLDYVKDIINLLRSSPKRSAILAQFQSESESPNVSQTALRPLCPTRWTTRERSINSLLINYSAIESTLSEITETDRSDAGTKANGLLKCMNTFSFYFALKTGLIVFENTEMLSKVLQSNTITTTEALKAAEQTKAKLRRYRDDDSWASLWALCLSEATRLNVDAPQVPRVRRPPHRFDDGAPAAEPAVEQHHRVIFFKLLDSILATMHERLEQDVMHLYALVERTILSAANNSTEPGPGTDDDQAIANICAHFCNDLDQRKLRLNLSMLHDLMNGKVAKNISDVTSAINGLGEASRLYAELSKLIVLLLVIPVSSATAERSFSCLRRLKTYLRSTMGQERLNHLMVLTVHQDKTDTINLKSVANDFVSLNNTRRNVFGKFTDD